MDKDLRKYVTLSMMMAIAIVLNIVEAQLFFFIPVPGAKLGLANIVTVIVLYAFGFKEAFLVTVLRIFLASLLMGRLLNPTFFMGMSGGVLAVLAMGLFKKINFFGETGTSLFGSLAHIVGQVAVGYFIIGPGIFPSLPLMLTLGIITGFIIGLMSNQFLKTSKSWLTEESEKAKNQDTTINGKIINVSMFCPYRRFYKKQIVRNK